MNNGINFSLGKSTEKATYPKRWYNTVDGASKAVQTLAGFHLLIDARHKAGYRDGERLTSLIVLGMWSLDTCGNAMKAISERGCSTPKAIYKQLGHELSDVVASEDFWDFVSLCIQDKDKQPSVSFGMRDDIPYPRVVCSVCGKPWTIEDCDDAVTSHKTEDRPLAEYVGMTLKDYENLLNCRSDGVYMIQPDLAIRNDKYIDLTPDPGFPVLKKNERGWLREKEMAAISPNGDKWQYVIQEGDDAMVNIWTYQHPACKDDALKATTREEIMKVFRDAMIITGRWEEIPNEYGSASYNGPWFNVATTFGKVKIGWRKRVVSIEVTFPEGKPLTLTTLFSDEDVTKWENGIHAWGYEKAAEYLCRISRAYAKFYA